MEYLNAGLERAAPVLTTKLSGAPQRLGESF